MQSNTYAFAFFVSQRQLTTEASMRKYGRESHLRCKSACCCIANAISIERLRTPTYKKRIHDMKIYNDNTREITQEKLPKGNLGQVSLWSPVISRLLK